MRIGVDVGGTFTDAVSVDEHGHVSTAKTLTTRDDVSRGTLAALGDLGAISDIDSIVHGTTLVTNALVERNTAPVGLLTTEGFRDTLEIRRTRRARTLRRPSIGTSRRRSCAGATGLKCVRGSTMTDKVEIEIPAPASGRLARIVHGAGADCPVGTVIGVIS